MLIRQSSRRLSRLIYKVLARVPGIEVIVIVYKVAAQPCANGRALGN